MSAGLEDIAVRGAPAEQIEALIERYTENLMRAAFSLGFGETEAEELVQDTFCAFLEGSHRFEKRSRVLTYLFGILYNKARESRRYQGRHDSIDAAIDARFDSHFDAEEHWNPESERQMSEVEEKTQASQLSQWIDDCLEGLTATMRMAFAMKEIEQLDTDTICISLALSPSNLGVTLFRARNKLRDCLTAKGAVLL